MDVQVLRWFDQVARGATITQVAQRSYVSQSGVSRALARLAGEVGGGDLFERSGRVLRLTAAGRAFAPQAAELLASLDRGLADVARVADPETGLIPLGFQQSLAAWLVPDLVRTFRVAHPKIEFALTQVIDNDELALNEGTADLELSSRAVPVPGGSYPILVEPLVLAVPRDHRLARRRRIALAEAASEPFIALLPTATLRRLGDALSHGAGFAPHVVFEGVDLATVRGLVAGGLGVAIVPAPRVGGVDPDASIRYCKLSDRGAEREIRLVWPADRELTPPVAAFREHVIRRSRRHQLPPVLK